jgi:anti-anti-sigma factor
MVTGQHANPSSSRHGQQAVLLDLHEHHASGHAVVSLRGELDLCTADRLWEVASAFLGPGRAPLVLELSELAFLDCAGIGVLVRIRSQAVQNDQIVKLAAPRPHVEKVLILGRVHQIFPVFTDLAAAVAPPAEPPETPATLTVQ